MKTTSIKTLYKDTGAFEGQAVTVAGWVRTVRGSKAFGFIELNDGTFFKGIQIVFDQEIENFKEVSKLGVGAAIIATGHVILTPNAKQPFEIKATGIEVEGNSPPEYPLQKKRHTFEYLRQIAHLRPRTNTFAAVFRVRSLASFAIHKFFQERNFVYTHTPIITANDAEGAGEMFHVTTIDPANPPKTEEGAINYKEDFFGKMSNLTVSGQLNAETFAMAFRDVYTFGPTFRAENSHTPRHAAEFWMLEPEIAFADLNDNMNLAEDMVKFVVQYILDHAPEEMAFFNQFVDKDVMNRLNILLESDFVRVSYTDSIEILKAAERKFEYDVFWGCDLQTEHERYLTEEHFKKPVFVTDYPKDIKAFYMRMNEDNATVAAMDLLVPGIGELIGGSQREERLDVLEARMAELGLETAGYEWYLDLRRFGGTRHAGFGLGFERLIMYVTGMTNIRDVIPFPRTPGSAEF